MCRTCDELHAKWEIRSPQDLAKAIRVIQASIEAGTLNVLAHPTVESMSAFDTVPADGPWCDVLAYWFSCGQCETRFSLFAETYHGAGGSWQPIDGERRRGDAA